MLWFSSGGQRTTHVYVPGGAITCSDLLSHAGNPVKCSLKASMSHGWCLYPRVGEMGQRAAVNSGQAGLHISSGPGWAAYEFRARLGYIEILSQKLQCQQKITKQT